MPVWQAWRAILSDPRSDHLMGLGWLGTARDSPTRPQRDLRRFGRMRGLVANSSLLSGHCWCEGRPPQVCYTARSAQPGAATYRGGLYAPAGLRARPARPVDEQVAALPLEAGPHVTPLLGPDDPGCGGERQRLVSPCWPGTRRHPATQPPGMAEPGWEGCVSIWGALPPCHCSSPPVTQLCVSLWPKSDCAAGRRDGGQCRQSREVPRPLPGGDGLVLSFV